MKSWLPWQYIVRVAARRQGFVDPIELLARLRRFAQPSEVHEPIELVRAGMIFHARGLINTKVFQYNLDWIWPYWVVRQFDPADASFLPRAFSFSHVNLTHRNWTALGLPGSDDYPIVDPRGLVTLPEDPWSLDWWFVPERGAPMYPSCESQVVQHLDLTTGLTVATRCERAGLVLASTAAVVEDRAHSRDATGRVVLEAEVRSAVGGLLVLAARPANPEGVHFIEHVEFVEDGWVVNHRHRVRLHPRPDGLVASTYAEGDLPDRLTTQQAPDTHIQCPSGMATAAATFRVRAGEPLTARAVVELVPLARARSKQTAVALASNFSWDEALRGVPELVVPDARWRFLHAAALRTIVLLTPGDVFPGPSTYRRFWFRDACLVLHALLAANRDNRVAAALERFPARQRADGYFHSQEGEWDANGQVLWLAERYERMTNRMLPEPFVAALRRGAHWITRKRLPAQGRRHAGLLPPGFSAEHLGPVDQYYWDDFWGIRGLQAGATLFPRHGEAEVGENLARDAAEFVAAVRQSLSELPAGVAVHGLPASPHRRMDAGAIGSMVADYPLQLDDVVTKERILKTADWLWRKCRYAGGFFQDMVHSGINAYLTLALAQTFLRHGDSRHEGLMDAVAGLASPTGQWPEAVHPRTLGGCMGDGQHTWAAAEWILAMRALFVREEANHLVLGAGVRAAWLETGARLAYGPTNTGWGPVTVNFTARDDTWHLEVVGRWYGAAPRLHVAVPGFVAEEVAAGGAHRLTPIGPTVRSR